MPAPNKDNTVNKTMADPIEIAVDSRPVNLFTINLRGR